MQQGMILFTLFSLDYQSLTVGFSDLFLKDKSNVLCGTYYSRLNLQPSGLLFFHQRNWLGWSYISLTLLKLTLYQGCYKNISTERTQLRFFYGESLQYTTILAMHIIS